MGHRFAQIAFTESVQQAQQTLGSRAGYASMEQGEDYNHVLGARETEFIIARDSFYIASVSETGWPYVQHRGGPVGFVKVLNERTLGFADFSGNRQYITLGNVRKDDRVSLFFMDYPNRTRLKLLGRIELITLEQTDRLSELEVDDYRAIVERGFLIHIEAFDWNCPQHITPRYTETEVQALIAPIIEENQILKSRSSSPDLSTTEAIGEGSLELVISGIRQLTPQIRAYELRSPDGKDLPEFTAGAHLQVPIKLKDGQITVRHYSICSDSSRTDAYEIAVLREDEGSGGSVAVHESFNIGLYLYCSYPQNNFPLHADDRSTILIAGGIGITPILAMARELKSRGTQFELHYAGHSKEHMAFRDQLNREFFEESTLYSSMDNERINLEHLLSTASNNTLFYVCGPNRLVDAVYKTVDDLNLDSKRIHVERFSATSDPGAKPIQLELRRSGKTLEVDSDQSILDAVLESGINAPFSCRTGICKTCVVKVLGGEPDHKDAVLSETERNEGRLICPCVSRSLSENLILDL